MMWAPKYSRAGMAYCLRANMCNDIASILNAHLRLGPHKPVSYLPIRTIESVLGLSVGEYRAMIEQAGFRCLVIPANESCIASGSVHAYSEFALADLLSAHAIALSEHGWPTSSGAFVRRIATEWLEDGHPVLPIVRIAFRD
jgi:hypothetical protein